MGRALWLAEVLRAGGCAVIECDGWQDRGADTLEAGGVVGHHTAGPPAGGDMPSLATLIHGRPDLEGPLSQLGLGRSGTYYAVASGRAHHAGAGGWNGLEGNSSVVGIEAENDGYQPWPAVQLDAYWRGSALLLEHLGAEPAMWCRHHEWRAEKPDPHGLEGDYCRTQIAAALEVSEVDPMYAAMLSRITELYGAAGRPPGSIDPAGLNGWYGAYVAAAGDPLATMAVDQDLRRDLGLPV